MKICIFEESLVTLEKKLKKEKLELITTHLKETRDEALRTMTVQGNVFYKSQKQSLMMMMRKATTLSWGKHAVRRVRVRRASVRRVTRVSLSHSQRDRVAQEVGVMHQVSYSSSVSTFCRNEIKDRNYKSVQQHIFISFSFSGKKWLAPLCSM